MPGRSFVWMATGRESKTCHEQFSARNSSYLDQVTLLHLKHNYNLPRPPPSALTTDFAYRGESDSVMRGLNTVQQDNIGGLLKSVPPSCNISYHPNQNTSLKDSSQSSLINGIGLQDKAINDASCAPQKQLLIFDQSGNRTRLFFSPSFSPPNLVFASETPASANGYGHVATRVDEGFVMKPIVEEKWDENHLSDGEGEMLEDTEEINALLYSDSDDEDDDDENDEVTSTGQSPLSKKEFEELREEVASSDDSPKRRRLLDGKYKKSSSVATGERAISCNHEDDVESIYAFDRNPYDGDLDSCKRETKVKIRHALKMLESIVPGINSKDPLSIIDKAIVYLKSMKIEAESLGLRHFG